MADTVEIELGQLASQSRVSINGKQLDFVRGIKLGADSLGRTKVTLEVLSAKVLLKGLVEVEIKDIQ